MPLTLIAVVLAARWINRRFLDTAGAPSKLGIGLMALGLMFNAELAVGVALRGMSPIESLVNRDPVSGTAYYASLVLFAAMTWLLSRR